MNRKPLGGGSSDPDSNQQSLSGSFNLSAADVQILLRLCARGEQTLYFELANIARFQFDPGFMRSGYYVADAQHLTARTHGRRKLQIVQLLEKDLIVALNPPFSHQQRYLLGCRFENADYWGTWIQSCCDWRQLLISGQPVSKWALRPSAAETPVSLKNKGFVPAVPSLPTLYREPEIYASPQAQNGDRKQRSPIASATLYQQRLALADEIARLAGSKPNSRGKAGALLDCLIRDFGFKEAGAMARRAWSKKRELLNDQYPMFTAQTVYYYARFRQTSNLESRVNDFQTADGFAQLVRDCTDNGDINLERLSSRVSLYGVQGSSLVRSACAELGIDPARLFCSESSEEMD